VFAETAARAVADDIAARIRGAGAVDPYDGKGSCYIEFGGGLVGKVDADFLSGPSPVAPFFGPSRELAGDKERFVSTRRKRWFGPRAGTATALSKPGQVSVYTRRISPVRSNAAAESAGVMASWMNRMITSLGWAVSHASIPPSAASRLDLRGFSLVLRRDGEVHRCPTLRPRVDGLR
jgi:hypothetical protein